MKEEFIRLLQSTGRQGIDQLTEHLERLGFFTAPASTGFHLSRDGGLLEHSLNVCKTALRLRSAMIEMKPELEERLSESSVIIATLLHDICKSDIYIKKTKYRKDEYGRWETYEGYDADYTHFPMGHGEKSVIMLLTLGIKLTADEMAAIRWHMSSWEMPFQSYEARSSIGAAYDKYPLVSIVQAADNMATHILEV